MSTSMLDISEVNSPVSTSNNFKVAPMRTSTNLTSRAPSKMSRCSEVPSPLFYTMDPTIISCTEALPLKTLYSLSTSLDMYESPSKWHKITPVPPDSIYTMAPAYKDHKIKSPSNLYELRIIGSNSSSPETDAPVKVDQASKWHGFESIIMMSPLRKLIPASEWHVIHLAMPRSVYKVILASKRYEIKTPSQTAEVKLSSSLCLKYPRLQYLRYKKSQPREGITRHGATSGQLPASCH